MLYWLLLLNANFVYDKYLHAYLEKRRRKRHVCLIKNQLFIYLLTKKYYVYGVKISNYKNQASQVDLNDRRLLVIIS